MRNKPAKWIIAAAAVMVGLPGLTVAFAGPAGMAVCLVLFFVVNPVFCAAAGVFAGRDASTRWILPLADAALFLFGVWLFFEFGQPDFLWYGGAYLVIGILAMVFSALYKAKKG